MILISGAELVTYEVIIIILLAILRLWSMTRRVVKSIEEIDQGINFFSELELISISVLQVGKLFLTHR